MNSSSIFASSNFSEKKYHQIEDNLLVGIKSENRGLQISCAYFLGEMKSERAVIPLLRMLKSGGTEEERIMAALSLSKIKTEQGLFAVKQRIKFDDSERVQRLCEIFYTNYLVQKLKGDVIVEPFRVVDLDMEYNGIKLAEFASK
jgi:HEAT repeat protein